MFQRILGIEMGKSSFEIAITDLVLARARKGEAAAIEEIYKTFCGPVYTLALRICASADKAEDVVQDTFMEAFAKLDQYRGEAPFWGWLRRVAINNTLQKLRAQKRLSLVPTDDQYHELEYPHETNPANTMDLDKMLSRLPATTRSVVWLHDVEGYTHREIAGMMGKSESFSKSQLARAYEKLRKWLKSHATDYQNIQVRKNC